MVLSGDRGTTLAAVQACPGRISASVRHRAQASPTLPEPMTAIRSASTITSPHDPGDPRSRPSDLAVGLPETLFVPDPCY